MLTAFLILQAFTLALVVATIAAAAHSRKPHVEN